MLKQAKRWAVVLGAAATVTASTMVVVAFAETPAPGDQTNTQKTDYRQVFLGKLATLLGVDQQKLVDATKQAGKDTVDDAVKNGDLAQARADAVKSRIDQAQGGFGFPGSFGIGAGRRHGMGFGGPGRGCGIGFGGLGGVGCQAVAQAAAGKLGMTEQELKSALHFGKSLSDVAAEKNVPIEEVRNAMVAAAKPLLDQAVVDGRLTQRQEDAILQRIQQGDLFGLHGRRGRW